MEKRLINEITQLIMSNHSYELEYRLKVRYEFNKSLNPNKKWKYY